MRRTHQSIPKRSLTSHDRVSEPHTLHDANLTRDLQKMGYGDGMG